MAMSEVSHRRQVANYIFITNCRQFSYSLHVLSAHSENNMYHLGVCPVSLSVLPRSLIPLGKGTILLSSPHSPAITNELVSGFLKVSLFTFLFHQPFITVHLFPQNCLTNRKGRKCWLSELIPSAQQSIGLEGPFPFSFLLNKTKLRTPNRRCWQSHSAVDSNG